MSLIYVTAFFECDQCGSRFSIAVDQSRDVLEGCDIFDIAEEAIRGDGFCSVTDHQHYCADCTKERDNQQ